MQACPTACRALLIEQFCQVHQARAEARETEAAAEQRFAAALALERAELDKQVQHSLYVQQCGSAAPLWLALSDGACARQWFETAAHDMQM